MKPSKQTIIAAVLVLVTVPIGFYSKFYDGPGKAWANNSLGGVFYEIFWCLAIFVLVKKPAKIAIWVFVATCGLEFLQLWHPVFLEKIRDTFIGVTLLGNSFTWIDMIYYAIGCVLSYFIMRRILKRNKAVNGKQGFQ